MVWRWSSATYEALWEGVNARLPWKLGQNYLFDPRSHVLWFCSSREQLQQEIANKNTGKSKVVNTLFTLLFSSESRDKETIQYPTKHEEPKDGTNFVWIVDIL